MPTNFYFQQGDSIGTTNEQRLIEDLIVESIKIYGNDVYYLPRTVVNEDLLFDEDTLSEFTQAYPIEMYLENVNGFDGEGDIFTKFGIEVRDSATFVLPRRRWEELVSTSGGVYNTDSRPAEGDLIYFPKTNSIFEIKLVDFANPFYQAGKLYVYRLECELFEYSSEEFETGIQAVDDFQDDNTLDQLEYGLLTEDGEYLIAEDSEPFTLEGFSVVKTNTTTDNYNFGTLNNIEDILDFTEINPFGEIGSNS